MFKNNQACKTMETWIDNLQKKDKVEHESAYSKWSKSLKSKNVQ